MSLTEDLKKIDTIFVDTAPIIYYFEGHSQFGSLAKTCIDAFKSGTVQAFTSVLTLTELLPKPVEKKQEGLIEKFIAFLRSSKDLTLIEISTDIAETAGRLRGTYPFLKTIDAIQISIAIGIKADAFLTNDIKLKRLTEVQVLVLKDYL